MLISRTRPFSAAVASVSASASVCPQANPFLSSQKHSRLAGGGNGRDIPVIIIASRALSQDDSARNVAFLFALLLVVFGLHGISSVSADSNEMKWNFIMNNQPGQMPSSVSRLCVSPAGWLAPMLMRSVGLSRHCHRHWNESNADRDGWME